MSYIRRRASAGPGICRSIGRIRVMPTKKPALLPEPLRYLQPFANALAKLQPDELNEDVDASRLEAALRKRIRDLDLEDAEARLEEDRELLEGWACGQA